MCDFLHIDVVVTVVRDLFLIFCLLLSVSFWQQLGDWLCFLESAFQEVGSTPPPLSLSISIYIYITLSLSSSLNLSFLQELLLLLGCGSSEGTLIDVLSEFLH